MIMKIGNFVLFTSLMHQFASNAVCKQRLHTRNAGAAIVTANSSSNRQERIFSLFSIVRFANSGCIANNGYDGTCYTSVECNNHGGTAFGSCASGFGVCCVVTISSCGLTAQINSTYWTNPGHNKSTFNTPGPCSLNVMKSSQDICQLRLDFIEFDIAQPDSSSSSTAGQCLTDVFTVNGQTNAVPPICGINLNQHIYLNMASNRNILNLNMVLSGSAVSRTWNIRITQFSCGTTYTAPDNCLQYFTEATGTIRSFNYLYSTTPIVQHLANQDYTICIRTNSGCCGIKYEACGSTGGQPAFAISGGGANGASISASAITDGTTGCKTDWLQVPCASDVINSAYLSTSTTSTLLPCVDKLCGVSFNALGDVSAKPIYSFSRPFELRFHTDSGEAVLGTVTSSSESYGFCLSYTQQACVTSSYG